VCTCASVCFSYPSKKHEDSEGTMRHSGLLLSVVVVFIMRVEQEISLD